MMDNMVIDDLLMDDGGGMGNIFWINLSQFYFKYS